ncbi:hypothetical protein V2J09_009745, partial [Rumex salicifolius]
KDDDKGGNCPQHPGKASLGQILRISVFKFCLCTGGRFSLLRSSINSFAHCTQNVSNFVDVESIFGADSRLVYKHYATLYFVFVYDSAENELAMLDLIQVFVETLDRCFKNVCELDIVFNYSKMNTILEEIIFGGQVLETNSAEVIKAVEEISKSILKFHQSDSQIGFGLAEPIDNSCLAFRFTSSILLRKSITSATLSSAQQKNSNKTQV